MTILGIQYASNLFVSKCSSWKQAQKLLKVGASKHLALLGNIGQPSSPKTKEFIRWCSEHWENVYCVPGPLELTQTRSLYGLFSKIPNNVYLLDQQILEVNPYFTLAGCPLWSAHAKLFKMFTNWNESERALMAFKEPREIEFFHKEDLEFLSQTIVNLETQTPYKNIVFLTHHLPSRELIVPSSTLQIPRQIILQDGDIQKFFEYPKLAGSLSGASFQSVSGFIGSHRSFCGVNPAFQNDNLVPNPTYRPDMVAYFQHTKPPVKSKTNPSNFLASLKMYLPKPVLAIGDENPIL
jgi:hypothetical protein